MEEFRVGDEIVSRPEDRPEAANTVRKVTRLLTRSGRVLELWVAGRVVATTHEHPFWVVGQGWVTANALRVGDEFLTSDGRVVTLERVVDDERYVSVYNLEVEADHTYFVGDAGWGFDLWSHNHNEGLVGTTGKTHAQLLDEARAARDILGLRLGATPKSRPSMVTAGYNTETGQVAAASSGKRVGGRRCAENHVQDALGGPGAKVNFTEPVRPRAALPLKERPVCGLCENDFGRGAFPPGTQFATDIPPVVPSTGVGN